jgi:hypothetical protein
MEVYVPSMDEVQASIDELQQVINQQAQVLLAQRAEFRYMAVACGLDSESRSDQVCEAVLDMASRRFAELGYVSASNFESYMQEHVHELTLIRDPERLWRSKGDPVPVFRLRPSLNSRNG